MTSIYDASSSCFGLFEALRAALATTPPEFLSQMPAEMIEEECGRFKVWMGNLGALQTGHSSLDFRLRDSTVMQTNIMKLLAQLRGALEESIAVASETRLPFELQKPDDSSDDDSSQSSSEEDADVGLEPKKELQQRLSSITNIILDLYNLSFKIRNSATRSKPIKAALYTEVDRDSGIELFSRYAELDSCYVTELFHKLRKDRPEIKDENIFLIERLSRAITIRRKQFRYWRRHSGKLSVGNPLTEATAEEASLRPEQAIRSLDQGVQTTKEGFMKMNMTQSVFSRSMFSGTEATTYDKRLDHTLETQSVISYAPTAYGVEGRGVDLPTPPPAASKGLGFVCPYCMVLCAPKYGSGKAWRAHVIHDLQPYVCTYPNCPEQDKMYGSWRQWLEHEGTFHRKVWQCFEHSSAVFGSPSDFRSHLNSSHPEGLTEQQVSDILDVSHTYTVDDRTCCPICLLEITPVAQLHGHIAHHLEAIACFALPKGTFGEEDSQAGSNAPQGRSQGSVASWVSGSLNFSEVGSLLTPEASDDEAPASQHQSDTRQPMPIREWLLNSTVVKPTKDKKSDYELLYDLPSPKKPETEWPPEDEWPPNPNVVEPAKDKHSDYNPKYPLPLEGQISFKWMPGHLIRKEKYAETYLAMNVGTGELITSKRVEEPWILSQAGELIPVFKDLHHENIVSYLGYELNGSIGWFFFEYIPGGTVAECLRKYGRLSEPVIRHIVKQTLFGLAYLHERSLCHGDLTADSIMLDSDSVCKIDMSLLSASQYSLGISMISDDIWRLGFTAVEMFSGRQLGDFMRRPLAKAPPIPKDVSAVISPEGASFIHDCFTVDPLDRPSAKDLLSHPFSHLDKNFNFFDTETFPQMRQGPQRSSVSDKDDARAGTVVQSLTQEESHQLQGHSHPETGPTVESVSEKSLDITHQPGQDRWAQIRKNAEERAAGLREDQPEGSRVHNASTDEEALSEEETIESRVARIKARVAELTGSEDREEESHQPQGHSHPETEPTVESVSEKSLDITHQPGQDRWAQIRKNAEERAAGLREDQPEGSRVHNASTDEEALSEEETIESRVARIKARVAELTGSEYRDRDH